MENCWKNCDFRDFSRRTGRIEASVGGLNLPPFLQNLTVAIVWIASGGAVLAGEDQAHPARHPDERLHSLEADYEIRRDGTVAFEQRFRLGVAGSMIRRGPILNYLTVFSGPGGLILDNELEVAEVLRDGEPEPFRVERGEGFLSLYVGSAERELEHRVHDYAIRGSMRADWRRGEGEFSTIFDLVGPLPRLPLDAASATIRLPEGVAFSRFTPSATGVDPAAERHGPAVAAEAAGNVLSVRSTTPMGEDRTFFVNLAWPSAGFAMKSQWLQVMRQHPRLPLAGFSSILLAWALGVLVIRMVRKRRA